ncbi:MAG: hypothetical protein HYS24_03500 [Ignavibacteriales bacterium]|nr:hypothetical protein [Ignavibacteriales bacterium]
MASYNLDNFKDAMIQKAIEPGKILKVFTPITNPPKWKYIILLSVNPKIRYAFISSEMYGNNEGNVELLKCDYNFFTNDISYINCADIKSNYTLESLILELQNIDNIFDKVKNDKILEIYKAIDCETVSKKVVEEIKASLQ